jgi:CRISPR/Cas system-associated exonuclease Cas4 (RecB family)
MTQLLDRLLQKLQEIPVSQWHKTAVIFPGRRAGVILRRKLAESLQQPVFSPAIMSLPDLLSQETQLRISDPVQLQFELYEAYLSLAPNETFESFLKWGPAVLRDFSETDAYLLDADQLFGYLSREKAIDLWNPGGNSLSASAQDYLAFFSQLGSLYHLLRQRLQNKGEGWQSLLSRQLAEALQQQTHVYQYDHYLFAGFNALNKAESSLMKAMISSGKAQLLLEADAYYMQQEHEAGLFMRQYANDPVLGRDLLYNGHLAGGDSSITVIETTGQAAQLQFASEKVSEWLAAGIKAEDCVLVLADEKLLVPLLAALPPELKALNITLGYPLEASHIFALLTAHMQVLTQVHEKAGVYWFYYHDLLRLLQNPLFTSESSRKAVSQLRKAGRIRSSQAQLSELLQQHEACGADWWALGQSTPDNWIPLWLQLLEKLTRDKKIDDLQKGMCLQMLTLLRRLAGRVKQYPALNNWTLFKQLLQQSVKNEQIAFLGEPFAGMQLMGVLETRALAFKNVLVLGLNEGKLPALSRQDGFITFSLRQAFALPGPREKEAVFAYHFYRLLQHAESAWLLCSGSTDDMGAGEPSRYIRQLQLEWLGREKGNFHYQLLDLPAAKGNPINEPIVITKTEEIQALIKERLDQPISPSALISLISCELKFYFSRLLRIYAPDDLQEDADARELGDILHLSLERLYQPYLHKQLHPQDVEAMQKLAESTLDTVLMEKYAERNFETGLNLLVKRMAAAYLGRFLTKEKKLSKHHQLEIIGLETELSATFNSKYGTHTLRGFADRIDRLDGTLRVLDYKTGAFKSKEVEIEGLHDDFFNPKKGKAFQLLAYAWMYQRSTSNHGEITSAIISFRQLNAEAGELSIKNGQIDEALLQTFEEKLQELIERLYDQNRPISQTLDLKECEKCDFRSICNR